MVQELGWLHNTLAFTGWKNSYRSQGLILWAKSFQSEVILNYRIRILASEKFVQLLEVRVPILSLKNLRGRSRCPTEQGA